MKKSFYNIIIENLPNGDVLLFNSFAGSFGVMDCKYKNIYDNIESLDIDAIKDEDALNYLNIMIKNGFIIEDNFNETDFIKARSNVLRNMNRTFNLTVAPTLNCNMECPYCFQKKEYSNMSLEVQHNTINFVSKNIDRHSGLHVTWFGGEPLLQLNTIINLSEKFIDIANNKNIPYSTEMITNGYLLDYNTAKMLKEKCKLRRVQVTIDGLEDTHNKRRKLKNGDNSFEKIINNIRNIHNLLEVIIRINIDKENIEQVIPLINYLEETELIDKVKINFAPVFISEYCGGYDSNTTIDTLKFANISSAFMKYLIDKNIVKFNYLRPIPRFYYCGACTINQYCVDPNGELYKCWEVIGDEKYSIGNVINNDIQLNPEHIKWLNSSFDDKCKNCNILPLCMGGCIHKLINNNNKICDNKALDFEKNLKIIYNEFIKIS